MGKFFTEVHLSREMSLLDVTMIGVGAMIGAGIFVLTGLAAGVAGPALIIAFLLNGFVAVFTAMSYAELGSCYHDAGGGYLWVKEGLPKWNGFLSGWMSWFAHAVACSVYAIGFGAYFGHALGEMGVHMPQLPFISPDKLLAVAVSVVFAYINFRGASETGKIGNLVTMTKIAILAIFIAFGIEVMLRRGDWMAAFHPFMPNGWSGVLKSMGLTFIAFEGYEVIAQSSEEIKNPRKNIPRAVFLSLVIVVPIYVLVAIASLGAVKPPAGVTPWAFLAQQKETALVTVASSFFTGGGVMLLIAGIISTMSALNATVFSSSRVAFAMGRDRNFPDFFSTVHAKRYTPHYAIFFSLLVIVIMSVSLPLEDVAAAADIMFLLLFLQVNVALIRLRKKRPDLNRGFFVPLFPWLTIVGILFLLGIAVYMFNYSPVGWFVTAGWIALGLAMYYGYSSRREVEHIRKVTALERLERKEFTILVPISNPKTSGGLLSAALAIGKQHDAEIVLLHIIEVDEGMPLRAGLSETKNIVPFMEESEDYVEKEGLPVRSIIKVAHRISKGILDTATEVEANFIILGREKHPGFFDRINASMIDTVLDQAPCEVAVLHGSIAPGRLKKIVIPYGENIHTRLAFEIAPAIVNYLKCKAEVVVVFEPGTPAAKKDEQLKKIKTLTTSNGLNAKITVSTSRDILAGVLRLSRGADLIVMGGRSGDFLGLLFGQSLTQEITERSTSPVLWVNEYEEQRSFWKRLKEPAMEEKEEKKEVEA